LETLKRFFPPYVVWGQQDKKNQAEMGRRDSSRCGGWLNRYTAWTPVFDVGKQSRHSQPIVLQLAINLLFLTLRPEVRCQSADKTMHGVNSCRTHTTRNNNYKTDHDILLREPWPQQKFLIVVYGDSIV